MTTDTPDIPARIFSAPVAMIVTFIAYIPGSCGCRGRAGDRAARWISLFRRRERQFPRTPVRSARIRRDLAPRAIALLAIGHGSRHHRRLPACRRVSEHRARFEIAAAL